MPTATAPTMAPSLPDLSSPVEPATLADDASALWRDGYVLMRGLVDSSAISSLRSELVEVAEEHRSEWTTKVLKKPDTSTPTDAQFDRVFGIRHKSAAGNVLASSKRLASIAAALLNVPCVRFYQDQLFFKAPGHQQSIWHQDSLAAPVDTNRLITLWLPLHNLTRAHGPLRFAIGSHTDLALNFWNEGMRQSKYPFFAYSAVEERYHIHQLSGVGPGDVSAHLGWTIHGAPANRATSTRMAYAISFFPDKTRSLPFVQLLAKYATDDRLTWQGRIEQADAVIDHPDFPLAYCQQLADASDEPQSAAQQAEATTDAAAAASFMFEPSLHRPKPTSAERKAGDGGDGRRRRGAKDEV